MSRRGRLSISVLASLGLHLAALATAASLILPADDRFLRDALNAPRLEVTLIAAAPPALVADTALRPEANAIRVFSKRPAPRAAPSAARESPDSKPETVYYGAREVDVRAVPITPIVPVNPDLSGHESGLVLLRLLINAGGQVDNVLVLRAEPAVTFGEAVLLPFKKATFLPARKAGIAVNSEMLIELHYGPLAEEKR